MRAQCTGTYQRLGFLARFVRGSYESQGEIVEPISTRMSFEHLLVQLLNRLSTPRPAKLGRGDLVLGTSSRRQQPFVVFPVKLRCQHLSIVGLSGTGKTYLIEHMIRQDIRDNVGFVVFDLHGDLAERIIAYLAERAPAYPEAYDRLVIVEPFNPDRTFGFNPLQGDEHTAPYAQAREFAHMLRARWSDSSLGFRTEELLRNALYALLTAGATLLALPRFLSDQSLRTALVRRLPADDDIRSYWLKRYDRLSPKMQAALCEPILTRLSSFLTDPQIRDILGQRKTTLDFKDAMQRGAWVVLNLAKGRLGENAAILGSMLLTKLELDIMARAHIPETDRRLFIVYADELQNLASDTIGRLIAEARKFKVSLVAGHQYWHQLEPTMRHALLAAGSKVFFRLHYHDAFELAGELASNEKARYTNLLTALDTGEAVFRIGAAAPSLATVLSHRPAKPTADEIAKLRDHSDRRVTRSRSDVRRELACQEDPAFPVFQERNNQSFIAADIDPPNDVPHA